MKRNKIDNYVRAVERLREAVEICAKAPGDTVYQDGVIQRFEFTFELAWKSLKEYLADQGFGDSLAFPKQVLKEAYAAGILTNSDAWAAMLNARNMTSHVYDEAVAREIVEAVSKTYLPLLAELKKYYLEH